MRDTGRVMSGELAGPNVVQLTRRIFAALNEGDVAEFIRSLGPDPVFDVSAWGFGVYEGNRAIRRFLEDWMGSFDRYERLPEEIIDMGSGVVFAAAVTRGVPAGGRAEITLPGVSVVVWSGEQIERVNNYRDIEAGRAAAEQIAKERSRTDGGAARGPGPTS